MPENPDNGLPARDKESRPAIAGDFYGRMARSSIWVVGGRWISRSIGVFSTIILARLLSPEDFGLAAIATILVGFAEIITQRGPRLAVVQKDSPDTDFINSAWTIMVLSGIIFGVISVALAPYFARYFNDPRAELVIYVMSLRIFMLGFDNIGLMLYIKEFNFKNDFLVNIYEKIFPFFITLGLAIYLRNYWALIIGTVIGHLGVIFTSYLMHVHRPQLCFKKIREVWSYSGWVLIESLGSFFTLRIDRFFIPGLGANSAMGHYHVGADLARLPTFELFLPLNRAFLPAYARLQHSPRELINTFINILSVAAIICLPVSAGFAIVADEAVRFIYGEKWAPMIDVVSWISVNAGVLAMLSTFYPVLQASASSRLSALITFAHAVLLFAGLFLMQAAFKDIADIAMIRTLISFAIIPFAVFCLRRVIPVTIMDMIKAVWRPLLATGAMSYVLIYFVTGFTELHIGLSLLLRIVAGAAVFTAVLGLGWLLSGRPAGAERALSRLVMQRLGLTKN